MPNGYELPMTSKQGRAFLDELFARQGESAGRGEVQAEGEGLRRAVGELPFTLPPRHTLTA